MSESTSPFIDPDRFYLCVKGIVKDADGRMLLLQRTLTTPVDPGLWDLPGGKLDPGELFDDAFRREVHEETGLHVTIIGTAGAFDWTMPERRIIYLILKAAATPGDVTLSDEHMASAWVLPDDLNRYAIAPQFLPLLAGEAAAKQ